MHISSNEVFYKNFGRCLRLSNGESEVYVTLDFGPRIIKYSFGDNGDNVFFEDINRQIRINSSEFKDVFGQDKAWFIYGGHRLWVSPEMMPNSYYPDNEPVNYEITETGAVFTPPQQKVNDIQLKLSVVFIAETSRVKINHEIVNKGTQIIKIAPWALSVMAPGGVSILPQNTRETKLLSNRNIILWPYTSMTDKRVMWGDKYITLKQDITAETPFKVGLNLERGCACYINNGLAFIKRFNHNINANYPDFGCSYETYTNSSFFEVESVGQLTLLEPNKSLSHDEFWELKRFDRSFDYKNEAEAGLVFEDLVK